MAVLAGAARAAISGEDPFLFHRQGRDWRWLSFGGAEARLAAGVPAAADWAADAPTAVLAELAKGWDRESVRGLLQRLPPSRTRDILVLDRPPAEAAGSLLLGWAAATGAALVLEPERERAAATIAWVRPTVVAGTPAEIARLGERLLVLGDPARLRRRRAPLGRVRALIVLGPEPVAPGEPWASLGAAAVAAE
jgi:hypothetical protein